MTQKLSNIPLKKYRNFLKNIGCECKRVKGGHEHWSRTDLSRSLTIQTHIDPVPEFIIRQHLRHLNISREKFLSVISKEKY